MNSRPLSWWDQAELLLLRLFSRVLGLLDGLLNVQWGERLLDRLAHRWRGQLGQLDAALAQLDVERQQLQAQAEALSLHAAAVYLGGRLLARGELCFDPADAHDDEILDATIDLLVKERLAEIDAQEVQAGHYVYHLAPDWAAIRARLTTVAERSDPQVNDWLREGIKFIDEALLSEAER